MKREWDKVTDNFSYSDLPLTNILEQMQDIDKKLGETLRKEILEYANTDLICYRVNSPEELRKLQDKRWNPILEIYYKNYGIKLVKTYGLKHVLQDQDSMKKFQKTLEKYKPQIRFIIFKISQSIRVSFTLRFGRKKNDR